MLDLSLDPKHDPISLMTEPHLSPKPRSLSHNTPHRSSPNGVLTAGEAPNGLPTADRSEGMPTAPGSADLLNGMPTVRGMPAAEDRQKPTAEDRQNPTAGPESASDLSESGDGGASVHP